METRLPGPRSSQGHIQHLVTLPIEVGLLDHNPLEDNTVGEIGQEAVDWLSDR